MAQIVKASRPALQAAGVAPLDGEADGRAVPVLDAVLPIPDSALSAYESQRYAARRSELVEAIDIDLEQVEELLSRPVPLDSATSHLDAVRAELDRMVHGLAAAAPAVAPRQAEAAPLTLAMPPDPARSEAHSKLARQLARRVVDLTRRAEAAEARVRELEAERSQEQAVLSTLGRRFGQWPRESFAAFVARLGMMAKAGPLNRAKGTPAEADDER